MRLLPTAVVAPAWSDVVEDIKDKAQAERDIAKLEAKVDAAPAEANPHEAEQRAPQD